MKVTNYAAAVVLGLVLVSGLLAGCKNHDNDNGDHPDHNTQLQIEHGQSPRG